MDETPTNLKFPCKYPLKVMGKNDLQFEAAVLAIMRKHVPDLSEGAVSIRQSNSGNFTALTITFTAQSKEQLDAIYQDLSAENLVIMAL